MSGQAEGSLEMEVALLHAWNSGHAVSDAVFRAWSRLWPEAEKLTSALLSRKREESEGIGQGRGFPSIDEAVLLPMSRNFDLILSTSPEASKAFPHCRSQLHLCYLPHSVPHEAAFNDSLKTSRERLAGYTTARFQFSQRLPVSRHAYLAPWSHETCPLAEQVTHWISASRSVRELNGLPTGMNSLVLYPPIDTQCFRPLNRQKEDFYLAVCRDRVIEGLDLAAEACRRVGKDFLIAATPEVAEEISGDLRECVEVFHKDAALAACYNRAAGVIFPGVVDFDPAMLEAQACGVPVIAFREGAALELVIDAEEGQQGTGLFFDELDIESLVSALEELERRPQRCSGPLGWSSAAAYSEAQFEKRTVRLVREVLHAEGIRTLDREIRSKTPRNQRRDAA